jgi:hypothetical protein
MQMFNKNCTEEETREICEDIAQSYEGEGDTKEGILSSLEGARFILNELEGDCYEEDEMFLFEQGGKYYINEAGHCSCYGFEGQWSPSEVTEEYLLSEHFLSQKRYNSVRDKVKKHLQKWFDEE